ncbi:radical SAM/SPASM domain-containing protein [Anaerosalibacter massiliensis]|uniref:Radical SAM protein n=1 Tax=Anaerosalibacter massiliensis TaxID=1347392 RepID=A0A9X2MHG0_9FIRM|nr:radical SAM protein [Anaerosalibacter massiliensis]MCR2043150.1 radical SAM protein [Anaerosalibacter massiliensis]
MKKRYFLNEICDTVFNDKKVILSNQFTGEWIKIPIECYKVIEYSFKKRIPVNKVIHAFRDEEDQKYFIQVLCRLEKIGLLEKEIIDDIKVDFIPRVIFSITNRCNLNCDYCCVTASLDKKLEYEDVLKTEDVKKAIDKIVTLNPQQIVLSGGEPLIRKDFFDIFYYVKGIYDEKLTLATNATLIRDEDIKTIAKNVYSIEISLDGFDEKTCAKVRGKGIFNRVIEVVKLLQENDLEKISLSMVVGNNNVQYVDKFNELNRKLGTKAVIRNFSKLGRGEYNFEKYLGEKNIEHYIGDDDLDIDIMKIKANSCQAGSSQLFVNYDGNVFLCPLLQYEEFKIGNILDLNDDLMEKILERKLPSFENFEKVKTKNILYCKNCKVNTFCTGCPAKMYTLLKNKEAFRYNCEFMKDKLMYKIWESF